MKPAPIKLWVQTSGLYRYWYYRGIIQNLASEANISFTQVDGSLNALQASHASRQLDKADGRRKSPFFPITFVSILHCMTQRIYIFLHSKQEGSESITEMNQVKGGRRKERKRKDKPAHFSWHWVTCSCTIAEWGQSGKISHPLHGWTECQASECLHLRAGEIRGYVSRWGVKWSTGEREEEGHLGKLRETLKLKC